VGAGKEFGGGCKPNVELPATNEQFDILQAERVVVSSGTSVFSWTQQEEKGDDRHIGDGLGSDGAPCAESGGEHVKNDLGWDRFYPVWRRICSGVGAELSADPKIDVSIGILADVRGPHPGKRLAHCS
jgi:hypothetical protein